jgi:tRNA U34 2-thiouridine synthase MnmA/TrmU
MARYRYRQTLIPAELCKDKRTVILKEPHFVPEGQSLVLYRDESSCAQGFGRTQRCLGGGVIESAKIE